MAATNPRTGQDIGNRVTTCTKRALGGHDRDSMLEKLWTDKMANGSFTSQAAQHTPLQWDVLSPGQCWERGGPVSVAPVSENIITSYHGSPSLF